MVASTDWLLPELGSSGVLDLGPGLGRLWGLFRGATRVYQVQVFFRLSPPPHDGGAVGWNVCEMNKRDGIT